MVRSWKETADSQTPIHGLLTTNSLVPNTELRDTDGVLVLIDLGTMVAVLDLKEEEQAEQGDF